MNEEEFWKKVDKSPGHSQTMAWGRQSYCKSKGILMDDENDTKIDLKSTDAALIFKEGEQNVDLCLPHTDDEDMVPPHVVLAVAIALRLKDEVWMKELITWFEEQADEAEVEESIVEKRVLN